MSWSAAGERDAAIAALESQLQHLDQPSKAIVNAHIAAARAMPAAAEGVTLRIESYGHVNTRQKPGAEIPQGVNDHVAPREPEFETTSGDGTFKATYLVPVAPTPEPVVDAPVNPPADQPPVE